MRRDWGPGNVSLKDLMKSIVGSPQHSKKHSTFNSSSRIREKRLMKYSGLWGKGSKEMWNVSYPYERASRMDSRTFSISLKITVLLPVVVSCEEIPPLHQEHWTGHPLPTGRWKTGDLGEYLR